MNLNIFATVTNKQVIKNVYDPQMLYFVFWLFSFDNPHQKLPQEPYLKMPLEDVIVFIF